LDPECQIRIEAFEGPLDLLLHLIFKNKLDITDIPIALVTSQYLEYLHFMKALDVVVAGEYLVMAATLMHIKSRMLLPRPEPADPEDDPRLEIVRPLQELAGIRESAAFLYSRPILGRDVFLREAGPPENGMAYRDGEDLGNDGLAPRVFEASLTDLIFAFRELLGRSALPRAVEISRARATLSEQMELIQGLLAGKRQISFFEVFASGSRNVLVVTFLAVLELARLNRIRLIQEVPGGDIMLVARVDNPG